MQSFGPGGNGDFKIKMRYHDVKKNANEYYYRDRKVTIDLLV
eukprot:SAG31_NODE_40034_length_283_cov_2.907609_1_plen_41_part_10